MELLAGRCLFKNDVQKETMHLFFLPLGWLKLSFTHCSVSPLCNLPSLLCWDLLMSSAARLSSAPCCQLWLLLDAALSCLCRFPSCCLRKGFWPSLPRPAPLLSELLPPTLLAIPAPCPQPQAATINWLAGIFSLLPCFLNCGLTLAAPDFWSYIDIC